MATNWPPADEIDVCNDDEVITEIIADHTNPAKNHMISPERMSPLLFSSPADTPEKKERGPSLGGGGGGQEGHRAFP